MTPEIAQPARTEESTAASPGPARDLIELAVGYTIILSVIWTENPAQRILYWMALATLIVITLLRRESLTSLGLGAQGFVRSFWVVGLASLFAAIAILAAWKLHTLHRHFGRVAIDLHFTRYVLWAFMQQFLIQDYFLARLVRLIRKPWLAVCIATLLFALAHIPNPVLVILTVVWGLIACALFLRYRNLYTLGIAHAILGITVAITVPNHIQHHMRVGIGYLHYHPRSAGVHPPHHE